MSIFIHSTVSYVPNQRWSEVLNASLFILALGLKWPPLWLPQGGRKEILIRQLLAQGALTLFMETGCNHPINSWKSWLYNTVIPKVNMKLKTHLASIMWHIGSARTGLWKVGILCQNGWREGVGMTQMCIKKVNGITFWFLVDFLIFWNGSEWQMVWRTENKFKHWNKASPSPDSFGRHTIQA